MASEWLGRLRWAADPLFWFSIALAVAVKLAVYHLSVINFLTYSYHYYWDMSFWVVEAYADFSAYYMTFVNQFLQGYLPYTPELWAPEGVQVYIYPPLFLYITTAFYFLPVEQLFPDLRALAAAGHDLHFARVGFSFVAFDLATCVVIYATVRLVTRSPGLPPLATLLYALNPISLWWGDYIWMSTPIHLFFLVLGFHFMLRGQLRWAAFWVAIATMVKQTAGLLLPVILLLELARSPRRAVISALIMGSVGVALSMPYLILYPSNYIHSITRGMGGYWFWDEPPSISFPVPVSILAFNLPDPIKYIIFLTVYYGLPFAVSLAALWACAYTLRQKPPTLYWDQLVSLAFLLSLATHTFFPRGIYKYYLIALLPFFLLVAPTLRGSILPPRMLTMPPLFRNLSRPLRRLPLQASRRAKSLLLMAWSIINRGETAWLLLFWTVSVAIYLVHKYVTPAILLALFLLYLLYAYLRFARSPTKSLREGHTHQPTDETVGKFDGPSERETA